MTRSARVGVVLVAFYLVVAAATTSWAPGRLRPLFDGFGSHPGVYNWVNPPREFAEGNQRPDSYEGIVRIEGSGSQDASMGPGDGQIALDLQPGSLAAHPPDTEATVTLTPVDASTLGALPAGLRPEGNAYRVRIAYDSGLEVVALDKEARVGLTSAAPADTMLYSSDGASWDTLAGQPLPSNNGITGPAATTGYYLAAAKGPLRELGGGSSSGSGPTVVIVIAALTVPVALGVVLLSRRRPATATGRRPPSGRPGPQGKKTPDRKGAGPAPKKATGKKAPQSKARNTGGQRRKPT